MKQIHLSLRAPMSVFLNGRWSALGTGLSLPTYGVDVTEKEVIVYSTTQGNEGESWHFPRSEVLCYVPVGFEPKFIPNRLEADCEKDHA